VPSPKSHSYVCVPVPVDVLLKPILTGNVQPDVDNTAKFACTPPEIFIKFGLLICLKQPLLFFTFKETVKLPATV
jgi:hypothetical protein